MGNDASQPFFLIDIQPVVDCVRVPFFQQTVPSHPIGGFPFSNLQKGSASFSHIRLGIVVPMMDQFLALFICQLQRS
jgi:hypothetical protein